MAILVILDFVFPLPLISTPHQEHHQEHHHELLTLHTTPLRPGQREGSHRVIARV